MRLRSAMLVRMDASPAGEAMRKRIQEMIDGPASRMRKLPAASSGRRFFSKVNAKSNVGELYLYDQIGADWYGGIGAKDVVAALESMKDAKSLNIYINSPGGDVFEAAAIYNVLDRFDGKKTCYIDGLAASAASYIPMVAERIVTASNALWMIHNPWGMAIGEAADMRKSAETLDQVRDIIVETYARRTKQSAEDLKKWMDEETWMDAALAKERGFTDEVTEEEEAATEDSMAAFGLLEKYKNTPQRFRKSPTQARNLRLAEADAYAIRVKNRASPGVSNVAASRGARQ